MLVGHTAQGAAPVPDGVTWQSGKRFRTDIQALRGIAVLLVVVYHSGLEVFSAGYLGVDMFFVISGFLITGIISRRLIEGRFSFADFYSRRVRRLLPAAYTVLVLTSLAAAWFLTQAQYQQFFVNVAGSLVFSANYTLWSQTGYFAPDSAFQPLLHMWSLAIEEQYYLLLPITLFIIPRRRWLALLIAASMISAAVGFYLAATRPGVAFFWLVPRAWELGIGSVAALIWQRDGVRKVASVLFWPALAGVALVPVWQLPGPTPGLGAAAICIATVIVILARKEGWDDNLLARGLAQVGDFSYSLYLVHWPMFALVRATRLTAELSAAASLGLIALSIVISFALYRFIENPCRNAGLAGRRLSFTAIAASLAVLALAWTLGQIKQRIAGSAPIEQPIEGLDRPGCFSEDVATLDGRCSETDEPEILLWGDSFSAQLVPGLVATTHRPLAQASKGHCTPFANYAAVATANEYEWTKGCLAFNASVIDYARETPSLKVVILSGYFSRTLPFASQFAIRAESDGSIERAPLGLAPTIAAQRETVAKLRSFGLRVVVVSSAPPSPFDMGVCWHRRAEGVPIFGPYANCRFRQDNSARTQQQFDALMTGFEQQADVPVIQLEDVLCAKRECRIEADGKPLFVDTGHLTRTGSMFVGKALNLGERAFKNAR